MELNPYAKYLDGRDPIPVLTSTSERIHALTGRLSTSEANTPPAPGKWSISNIVAHLADTEMVFAFRLRQTLAAPGESPAIIQPFDQEAWAQRYAVYNLEPAFALFHAARNWNLLFLATISQDDRDRPTNHPERGDMKLWTIVETMAGHDINHLQQLERLTAYR
jgi:uncharacterized damage-inducible protein DinB